MNRVAKDADNEELEAIESIKKLLRAGVELGVAEATRRLAVLSPGSEPSTKKGGVGALLGAAPLADLVQFVRTEPGSVFHLAKEVWSRGGLKEKKSAADAIGKGLGFFVPHKAIDAAKDLASMARSRAEAVMVGKKAIEPVLERNPAMLERVKKFLEDNEQLLRQAAIAGLVGYIGRRRKYAAVGVELLLLVAQRNEKEIRSAVRLGLRKMMEVDPKATALAILAWVRSDPTKERIQAAGNFLAQRAGDVKLALERGFFTTLSRFNGNGATAKNGATSAKPKKTKPRKKQASKPG